MRTLFRFNKSLGFLLSAAVVLTAAGCVSMVPIDEYTVARAALDAAKESEAPRYAPSLWYKAEQAYREGETLYRDRHFEDALIRFNQARALSEQAENAARVSRFESGDLAP